MLNQLTKYLLQYRQVSVPGVGTIRLVQHPATLDVADKVILPPSFTAELKEDDSVSEHQLRFLCRSLNERSEVVLHELEQTGRLLQEKLQGEGFHWKGIGLIRHTQEPFPVSVDTLQTIAAERIHRHDAEHNVLIGDQQKTFRPDTGIQEDFAEPAVRAKRSVYITIAWILLLLSVLYILFILYQGNFSLRSTGSRQSPISYLHIEQAVMCKTSTESLASI